MSLRLRKYRFSKQLFHWKATLHFLVKIYTNTLENGWMTQNTPEGLCWVACTESDNFCDNFRMQATFPAAPWSALGIYNKASLQRQQLVWPSVMSSLNTPLSSVKKNVYRWTKEEIKQCFLICVTETDNWLFGFKLAGARKRGKGWTVIVSSVNQPGSGWSMEAKAFRHMWDYSLL